jgi:hypothetical protein
MPLRRLASVSGSDARLRAKRNRSARLAAATVLLALGVLGATAAAQAASSVTYYAAQTGSGDCSSAANACSLTMAISDAGNANGENVTIDLAAGTYTGATAIPNGGSEASLTIEGSDATGTILNGAGATTLKVNASSLVVTVEDVTLENGFSSSGSGGNLDATGGATVDALDDAFVAGTSGSVAVTLGALLVRDSTITGSSGAAGVVDDSGAAAGVYGSTITGNSGGGVAADAGTLTLGADLLASNGNDCAMAGGTISDAGYDYSDDGTCPATSGTGNHAEPGTALAIGALASNGGGTQTERVTPTSVAYDVVPVGATLGTESQPFCSGTDQRVVPRAGPASACSAGAYQYAPPVVTGVSPTASVELGLPVTLTGYGLVDVTSADVGSTAATITSETAGSLSLDVPLSLSLGSQPITLKNPDGSTVVSFNAVAAPGVSTSLLPPGQYEIAYSQVLAVSGGAGPYTYALKSGALPVGLSLASSGVVSGTPTRAGGAAFGVTVTDANGVSSPSFTVSLVIATPVISIDSAKLKLTGSSLPVTLSCAAAPCKGTASLTESVKTRVKAKVKATTVVLASARYSLTSGQRGSVALALTPAGVKALKHVKKHSRKETLTVTSAAATTETSTVLVS